MLVILLLTRLVLACVWLSSAIGKLRNHRSFAHLVARYKLLPNRIIKPFAFTLPYIELVTGTLLLLGWQVRFTAMVSALLMFAFVVATRINLAKGRNDLECGCFAGGHHRIGSGLIWRDSIFLLMSLGLFLFGGGEPALDAQPDAIRLMIYKTLLEVLLPIGLTASSLTMITKLIRQLGRLFAIFSLRDGS